MFTQDFILNGEVNGGEFAQLLPSLRFDSGMLKPFFDDRGQRCVVINTGRKQWDEKGGVYVPVRQKVLIKDLIANGLDSPVFNDTTLRKQEWIELDKVILRAARYRMRAWADLAAQSSYGGFDGMSKMVLEHETMSDPGEAVQDMDGLADGRADTPKFQLQGLPLPITHSDFWYSKRRLNISRNSGTPLDTVMGEAAGRRVAEMIERQLIGNSTGITYGGANNPSYGRTPTVYGYLNFPARLTYTTVTAPTAGGWVPQNTLTNVLAMKQLLINAKFYGPFMVYHSNDWDRYMDNDYYVSITSGAVAPTKTLRERLREIDGVQDVRRLDMLFAAAPTASSASGTPSDAPGPGYAGLGLSLNPFTLLMVQMTTDVARAVNGMDISTIQWESHGGLRLNFKVMCIQVPQLRADYYNNCGICQGTVS
jgi:hypothetical protein